MNAADIATLRECQTALAPHDPGRARLLGYVIERAATTLAECTYPECQCVVVCQKWVAP